MRPPRGRGRFRRGRDGEGRGGGVRAGGRGGGGFSRDREGFRDEGPPSEVVEISSFLHACEGKAVTELTNAMIPELNAPIFLQNKTRIGTVEEIFGPVNKPHFSIKTSEGILATSYAKGDKFYIDPAKLQPLPQFLPQPFARFLPPPLAGFLSEPRISEQRRRAWEKLPEDVISVILGKSTTIDAYFRFGAVCKSWKAVNLRKESLDMIKKNHHLCSVPRLLLPYPKLTLNFEDVREQRLYSICSNKYYNLHVRRSVKEYCRGSSFGWLVTMEKQERSIKYYVRLQNPFLPPEYIIPLPSLPLQFPPAELPDGADYDSREEYIYLRKAVLSAPPDNNDNKNFVVMALVSKFHWLAYFNPASENANHWTPVGDLNIWTHFDDVIYFSKAQQFYAVKHTTGEVYAVHIREQRQGEDDGGSVLSPFTLVASPTPKPKKGSLLTRFIVELSSGDLLQVMQTSYYNEQGSGRCNFEVFQLDDIGKGWIQMHSLGDKFLFLGSNSSISRSVADFPEWNPNCIYFTESSHIWFNLSCRLYDTLYMGIYNLHDETIQPFVSTVSFAPQAFTPIWLEPSIPSGRDAAAKVSIPVTVVLSNIFTPAELRSNENLQAVIEEGVKKECEKCGPMDSIEVCENHPQGVVLARFKDKNDALKGTEELNGIWLNGKQVHASIDDGSVNHALIREEEYDYTQFEQVGADPEAE